MSYLHAFLRSAAYERRFLRKNPWDLAMVLWIPLVTVLLIWWIFSRTQITDLPIGVIDRDSSPMANTVVRYLDASPDISVTTRYSSQIEAQQAMLERHIYGVVVIPEDFSHNLLRGQPTPLVLQVNAQYGTHSGIIQKSVQSVVATLSAGAEVQRLVKQGMARSQAIINYAPISIQRISLFNAATNYQQFLASTVIPALLHILAMVIGATTIGRELRDRQIGRWYRFIDTDHPSLLTKENASLATDHKPTPSVPADMDNISMLMLLFGLLGKYCWPMLAYSVWAALALGLASYGQDIHCASLIAIYAGLVVLLLLSFFLGAIFTLGAFSLRMGLSATGFISAPSYAFAGVTFPYIAISDSAKHWSDILPLTHYLKLHIAQLQMRAPLAISLPILYGLSLVALVTLLLMTVLTKRALTHPERWGAR